MVRKIVPVVVGVILLGIALLLVLASTKPDTFRVERSATIKAQPETIFSLLNDFHQWPSWSPWEKMDPSMKRSFSGPASGPGSVYEWEGKKDVGSGKMEILESSPAKVSIRLDFLKPMEAHNTVEFTLYPVEGGTRVTWAMFGPSSFVTKIMHVFFNMDAMVGKDFEAGLANLKSSSEK